jgi:hypothetical protein
MVISSVGDRKATRNCILCRNLLPEMRDPRRDGASEFKHCAEKGMTSNGSRHMGKEGDDQMGGM